MVVSVEITTETRLENGVREMNIQTKFTSKEILEALENDNPHILEDAFSLCGVVEYQLTADEEKWADFVRGRYGIYDYISANTDEEGITSFYPEEFSRVLDDDGMTRKAVCLSDDTALQAIFFLGYEEAIG